MLTNLLCWSFVSESYYKIHLSFKLKVKFSDATIVNEKYDKQDDIFNIDEFNELKTMIDYSNQQRSEPQIRIQAIKSLKFAQKLGILKFPQVYFFRDSDFVLYKGIYLNKFLLVLSVIFQTSTCLGSYKAANMFSWIEETTEKKTFRLTDSTFEHDTQAGTGATTGDWFVML